MTSAMYALSRTSGTNTSPSNLARTSGLRIFGISAGSSMLMASTSKPSLRPVSRTGARLCAPAGDFRCHRAEADRLRKDVPHEFDAFDGGFLREDGNAGYVATGTGETFRKSRHDGIDGGESDDRNRPGRPIRRKGSGRADGDDGIDLARAHYFLGNRGQCIGISTGIAKLKPDIPPVNVAKLGQTPADAVDLGWNADWRELDHARRSARLLRMRKQRPRRRSANKPDELTTFHGHSLADVRTIARSLAFPASPLRERDNDITELGQVRAAGLSAMPPRHCERSEAIQLR